MKPLIYLLIIATSIIIILFFLNRSKRKRIEELTVDHAREKKEIENNINILVQCLENGEELSQVKTSTLEKLRLAIIQQQANAQTKYYKLVRAYMLARKKNEIEVTDEIERSIADDYEALGSKNIPVTDYLASAMADYYTSVIKETETQLRWMWLQSRSEKIADVRKNAAIIIERAKKNQYVYEYVLVQIMKEHPEITVEYIENRYGISLDEPPSITDYDSLIAKYEEQISSLKTKCKELERKANKYDSLYSDQERSIKEYKEFIDNRLPLLRESILDYQKQYSSNLTAIPYMSRIIADIMTIDIDRLVWALSWGNNQERKKKVQSLNAIKKEKSEEIERIKGAEYQLAYLLELYPTLQDVIDTDFRELEITYEQIEDYDPAFRFLERKEWDSLSESQRNQLALDRYIESRQKSKWQIGRDYELYCGYTFEQEGFIVNYYGSYNGINDLGRDLIIRKGNDIRIVQCKYWSKTKQIHEKHVMQLYGTVVEYNIENNQNAKGIIITNTTLSDRAKQFAKVLGITYIEEKQLGVFPRIKCNIGVGEYGEKTKIYHLPFDQQYDVTKIEKEGELMALTVEEAERLGFRRAYKWRGEE